MKKNTVVVIIATVAALWGLILGVLIGSIMGFSAALFTFSNEEGTPSFFSALVKGLLELESVDEYTEYFDVAVREYEKRNDGVYVRFENTGERTVDDLYFEIEERDENGNLIAEFEVNYMKPIKPGTTEEALLYPTDSEGEAAKISGEIKVHYSYGWISENAY